VAVGAGVGSDREESRRSILENTEVDTLLDTIARARAASRSSDGAGVPIGPAARA